MIGNGQNRPWDKLIVKAFDSTMRHGPVNVVRFVIASGRQRGFQWVLEYALADSLGRRGLLAGGMAVVEGSGVAINVKDARRIEAEAKAPAPAINSPPAWSLDAKYSMDPTQWNDYIGQLFLRTLLEPLSRAVNLANPNLCIIVEGDTLDADKLKQTTDAIKRVSAAAPFPVTARLIAGSDAVSADRVSFERVVTSRAAALDGLAPSDFTLWLRVGDAPRPELAPALMLHLQFGVELLIFDGYFYDFDRAYPILLPGVNAAQAMNVDYFYSRFLMLVGAIDPAELGNFGEPMTEPIRGWLRRRPSSMVSSGWRHVSAPVLHYNLCCSIIKDLRLAHLKSDQTYRLAHGGRDINHATVSLIICTKDKGNLLRQLINACLHRKNICEIIIVSNRTSNHFALELLSELSCIAKVKIVNYDASFNFSVQSNLAAKEAKGDFLLLLNDDIVPVTPDWLERLIEPFEDPAVGMTAPLLLYPNEKVQHAGMYLGLNACAGHTLRFATLPDQDYLFYASAPREVSSLSGAVLLVTRELYESLNGLDELLPTFLQDVDFCLRAKYSGFKNIFIPSSRLLHMESTSVLDHISRHDVAENRSREHAYFFQRWKHVLHCDPFHNPNFSLQEESLYFLRPPS